MIHRASGKSRSVSHLGCAIFGDCAIIISGRQFGIFSNISAHQMLRNVRFNTSYGRHMPAYERTSCTLHTRQHAHFIYLYTGTSTCEPSLIEDCATIGDWVFIFSHILNAVLLHVLLIKRYYWRPAPPPPFTTYMHSGSHALYGGQVRESEISVQVCSM